MKIKIEGMSCAHCEERICTALQKIEGVTVVSVNAEDNSAVITSKQKLNKEQIKEAIMNADRNGTYSVAEFEEDHTEISYPSDTMKLTKALNHANTQDDSDTQECCCSSKHKERDEKERRNLMNRLKRIEGQVRGIEKMLDNDIYCTDILVQVAAVNAALNSFNKVLLANHVRTCVAENIRNGNDEVIDELVVLLQKLMK